MTEPVVLFIAGVGRSGTTLIERILGTDPRFLALGEVSHLWRRSLMMDELCGCGLPFSECPFWGDVGNTAFGGWSHVDAQRALALRTRLDRVSRTPKLAWRAGSRRYRAELDEYGRLYASIYRAAATVTGAQVIIDSSKQPSTPFALRHQENLDVRVLHCIRDSRAVAYSWTKTVQRPEAQVESFGAMTRYSPGKMSMIWMAHNAAASFSRTAGLPLLALRYEDFVTDPRGAVSKILEFCGLAVDFGDALEPQEVELSPAHTCSGNPLRFATGRVKITRDDAWRAELPTGARRLVTGLTYPLLRRYGYRVDGS